MDKQISYANSNLICCSCYNAKNTSDAGILKILFDKDNNILGFMCPDCKAIWRIEQID